MARLLTVRLRNKNKIRLSRVSFEETQLSRREAPRRRYGENQGPRAASENQGRPAEPAQGSQGRACPPPRRQGHRWCTQQAIQDKGGEAVNCAGIDGDLAEAEGGSEGSLQEEEVPASRSASQEDQGNSAKAYQAPGIIED